MQRLIVGFRNFSIAAAPCSLLDRTLSSDGNLATSLCFQIFLCFTTWPNDQSNKVVLRMFFHRNANLFGSLAPKESTLPSCRVQVHEFFQQILTFRSHSISPTDGTSILSFSVSTIDGWWRGGPVPMSPRQCINSCRFSVEMLHSGVDFTQTSLAIGEFRMLLRRQIGWHTRKSQSRERFHSRLTRRWSRWSISTPTRSAFRSLISAIVVCISPSRTTLSWDRTLTFVAIG
mmetsp:Transcript_35189/g.85246  ORF Transcript_35189/g.85246 Transcript_35189/m.85246 type:complete len:231 (-) Transcript_35189:362-1054(-)